MPRIAIFLLCLSQEFKAMHSTATHGTSSLYDQPGRVGIPAVRVVIV